METRPSGDWVAVDVLDLLFDLAIGVDVEVVVAGLPEMFSGTFEEFSEDSPLMMTRRVEERVFWVR